MTDVGRARDHNEDDFYLSQGDEALCVVADGMGGHQSGEVASAMAIKSMVEYYRESMDAGSADSDVNGESVDIIRRRLVQAIQAANSAVFEAASENEIYHGMGTTIVSGYFTGEGVYLAHIGDSRAYRFRDGSLEQQTTDHSLANEYVRMGILSDEDLEFFPYKNVITRACGLSEEVEVACSYNPVSPGDIYLLCTDGLTDMVEPDEITSILESDESLDQVCRRLVETANQHGGEDNVTVVVARVDER
jgi:protein phosphatase